MNIHPLIVHFPIALLFLFSLLKLIPLAQWFPAVAWRDIERGLLLVGVAGAMVALSTGETAEHLIRPNRALVHVHSNFASIATFLYGALLAGETAAVINARAFTYGKRLQWVAPLLRHVETILCNPVFSAILALLGLVAISVTGMLGGVIVYGVTADPISPFLLKLLGIPLG